MNKLVLIDGNALIHRAFHAIKPLTTKNGEQVNAVYGFTSILLTILQDEQPAYIACAFDTAKKTFRHEQYKEYKATRVKAPDELYAQIPRIHEIVDNLNIPKFLLDGYEADDLIGTISAICEKKKEVDKVIIATSDMDALQLVSNKTCVNNLHKGYKESKCFNDMDIFEKYGIHANQVTDYKGLVGDTSDNIPGVYGIGEKTAVKLLQTYKNLEGVYENIGDIQSTVAEKLKHDKEKAFFSRTLATIDRNVPIDFDLDKARTHDFKIEQILELFESLQFYSLMRRLREWKKIPDPERTKIERKPVAKEQMSLF